MVLGTRGGHQQPQYLSQVAAAVLAAGKEAPEAQSQPRWHIDQPGGAGSVVSVEARMPERVVDGLERRGHTVTVGPDLPAAWGPVSMIRIGATRTGAADPRVSTATAAGD